jgi:hypothetical protein
MTYYLIDEMVAIFDFVLFYLLSRLWIAYTNPNPSTEAHELMETIDLATASRKSTNNSFEALNMVTHRLGGDRRQILQYQIHNLLQGVINSNKTSEQQFLVSLSLGLESLQHEPSRAKNYLGSHLSPQSKSTYLPTSNSSNLSCTQTCYPHLSCTAA